MDDAAGAGAGDGGVDGGAPAGSWDDGIDGTDGLAMSEAKRVMDGMLDEKMMAAPQRKVATADGGNAGKQQVTGDGCGCCCRSTRHGHRLNWG